MRLCGGGGGGGGGEREIIVCYFPSSYIYIHRWQDIMGHIFLNIGPEDMIGWTL